MTKTFDESILAQIITKLDDEDVRVKNIVHIGNNVFEMDYDDTQFLSGTFGKCQYMLENGKPKCLKYKVMGMS